MYQELLDMLKDPERVSVNETVLEHHAGGMDYHERKKPDVVVFPKTEEEVVSIVKYAAANKVAVVPFGAGSSLEGHLLPLKGGISMDFTLMNEVVAVYPEDFLVKVQPGVTRMQLNKHLKKYGLFFPIDPGADATIGGMAATNASGTNAVKYGTMKHNVLGLQAVLADGSVAAAGGQTVKSSAGYNLTELLVGSEGTLGIFTEITLKLAGIPEATVVAKASFESVEAAGKAAELVLQSGVGIGKMELVDAATIQAVNEFKGTDFEEVPTLFLEYSGTAEATEQGIALIKELMKDAGTVRFEFEHDSLKRAQLWEARHQAALAILSKKPGCKLVSTDVCLPISQLAVTIAHTRKLLDDYKLDGAILGHVGDGNFHVAFALDTENQDVMTRFHEFNEKMVKFAIDHRGTCTGEHGVGIGKMKFLKEERSTALPVMKMIKKALDPNNILNPGKIVEMEEVHS
ncbi:FAD-binding oxidoreductase [Cytobacillus sp. NCCP-133]|uniref:FAD-binding oxidoreductase n=1 Tax=Cytobacillus sp. NCCP-133 TaxID=766848 RepID=UPI00222E6AC4|nr:FAD-linked oxidase C-terminal domain-containing protein [Cytobacillus sp. NCCP-133]GLB60241.1 2-hydroxy-acid oxidase [Cytobacillus sp. NCCP-133]